MRVLTFASETPSTIYSASIVFDLHDSPESVFHRVASRVRWGRRGRKVVERFLDGLEGGRIEGRLSKSH